MGSPVITIRPFEEADVSAAFALEIANQPSPWSERVFRDEIEKEDRLYLVAADDDRLVGFAGVMLVGDEAHITNLLVDPDQRRQGIGSDLFEELMRSAVERGARHATLEVRSKNQAARQLYARHGLAPVGVRKDYYADDDAVIMWLHDVDERYRMGDL